MYAVAVCDPQTKDKSSQIGKVQHRAARWTACNYDRFASVSTMIEALGWQSLEQRQLTRDSLAVKIITFLQPNQKIKKRLFQCQRRPVLRDKLMPISFFSTR